MEDYMRKFLVFLLLLLSTFAYVNADEYLLFSGKCGEYNDVWKNMNERDYALKYDDENDVFYLRTADWINNAWIHLSWNDIAKLRTILEKYFEWEKLAIEKKVKLEKELPNATIATKVTWKYGDDWYSARNFQLSFVFFSQSESRHQLVLMTSKATGSNQFVTYKIDGYYFDSNQVKQFYDALGDNAIKEKIKEFKNNKEKESLFN